MPRTTYKYSALITQKAAQYLVNSDAPNVRELCRELDINSATCYRWKASHSEFSAIIAQIQKKKQENKKYFKREDGQFRHLRKSDGKIQGTPTASKLSAGPDLGAAQ